MDEALNHYREFLFRAALARRDFPHLNHGGWEPEMPLVHPGENRWIEAVRLAVMREVERKV